MSVLSGRAVRSALELCNELCPDTGAIPNLPRCCNNISFLPSQPPSPPGEKSTFLKLMTTQPASTGLALHRKNLLRLTCMGALLLSAIGVQGQTNIFDLAVKPAPGGANPAAVSQEPAGPAPAHKPAICPALPVIPNRVFNVKKYGAVGDGHATETKALQAAIDAAHKAGGGTVEIPAGNYLCGPLQLENYIRLQLDAGSILRMLPIDQYPGGTNNPKNFITASKLHDIAIAGPGKIEGQGDKWWPLAKTKGIKRPSMIILSGERILIEKITLNNSPQFHMGLRGSNITVRGVTVRAPASTDPVNPSHNTDACDVSGNTILVQDCDISVGDDNYTCGGGTSDVLITHCTYGYGHGVSIGSYTRGGVSNITVEDCTFTNTECGIRVKSDRDRGGLVEHLTYRNLRMTNVGCPIQIFGTYMVKTLMPDQRQFHNLDKITPEIAATYPAKPVERLTPIFHDITFSNITATVQSGHRAGIIWGLPEAVADHVLMENVTITADKPFGIFGAKEVRLVNCKITTPEGVNQLALDHAQVTVTP